MVHRWPMLSVCVCRYIVSKVRWGIQIQKFIVLEHTQLLLPLHNIFICILSIAQWNRQKQNSEAVAADISFPLLYSSVQHCSSILRSHSFVRNSDMGSLAVHSPRHSLVVNIIKDAFMLNVVDSDVPASHRPRLWLHFNRQLWLSIVFVLIFFHVRLNSNSCQCSFIIRTAASTGALVAMTQTHTRASHTVRAHCMLSRNGLQPIDKIHCHSIY